MEGRGREVQVEVMVGIMSITGEGKGNKHVMDEGWYREGGIEI